MSRCANLNTRLRNGVAICLATTAFATLTPSNGTAAIGQQDIQVASTPTQQSAPKSSLDFRVYHDWCDADRTQQDNWQVQLGYCLGYLQGLYWGQVIGSMDEERPFCLPAAFQKSDMVAALDAYATMHPAGVNVTMNAGETARHVAAAFKSYFTCD
jgi:hypothetical protein